MWFLDQNERLLLVANETNTYLLKKPELTLYGQSNTSFKLGCLQYATGIVAFAKGSCVQIYDFKLGRKIETVETYLNLVKVCIIKNILIGVSEERVLIYDLETKQNLCHIAIHSGKIVSIHRNYYQLKILYPIKSHIFQQQDIWGNKICRYEFHNAESIHYDESGTITCFLNKNVASLYEHDQIVRGCSFNSLVIDVRPAIKTDRKGSFFFMTEGGGKDNQPIFMEFSTLTKNYIKFAQKTQEPKIKGPEKGMLFTYGDDIYLWKDQSIFKGEIDEEPQFFKSEQFISPFNTLPPPLTNTNNVSFEVESKQVIEQEQQAQIIQSKLISGDGDQIGEGKQQGNMNE